MAKITFRKVNENSWVNNTWLQCYCGYIVKLVEYANGRIDMHLDGNIYKHCEGNYISQYNGWNYTLKKILSRPLSTTVMHNCKFKNLTNLTCSERQ